MAATPLAQATLPLGSRARWDPAEPAPPLPAGSVIDGRYQVIRLLGEGGMGRVYEAEHLFIRRRLALKLVRRDAGTGEGAARVVQEALVAGKVPHATVVPVYDCAALPDGQVYVAMELLRGESLEQALLRPQRAAEVLRWLAEVARGLAAAHRAGIVHRDVKPANLFLAADPEGGVQPRILDFGIAKLLPGLSGEAAAVQTQAGALLGTPYYMAPERARGDAGGPPSDLYSLGVILYEAITGQLPFFGDNFMEVIGRQLREAPLDPRQAAPDRAIPDALAELTLALLCKQPEGRPADGETVARALVDLAGSAAIAGLAAGPRGGDGAVGAEAATQSLVAAETRRIAADEDVLGDRMRGALAERATQRLAAAGLGGDVPEDRSAERATGADGAAQRSLRGSGPDGPADRATRAGASVTAGVAAADGSADRSMRAGASVSAGVAAADGSADRSMRAGASVSAGRSGGAAADGSGDSLTRRHAPGDSLGRGPAGGARTRSPLGLALAFVAAAGLGGWAAWQWTGPAAGAAETPATAERSVVQPAAERPSAVRPAPGPGSGAGVGGSSPGEVPTTSPTDGVPTSGTSPAPGEAPASGSSPGSTGGEASGSAVAPKKRPASKKTGGKAGTTGSGKDDRPRLKTDVYDD